VPLILAKSGIAAIRTLASPLLKGSRWALGQQPLSSSALRVLARKAQVPDRPGASTLMAYPLSPEST
jgi:hypothetical protein